MNGTLTALLVAGMPIHSPVLVPFITPFGRRDLLQHHFLDGDIEIGESGGEPGHRIEQRLATGWLPWARGVVDNVLGDDVFERGCVACREGFLEAANDQFVRIRHDLTSASGPRSTAQGRLTAWPLIHREVLQRCPRGRVGRCEAPSRKPPIGSRRGPRRIDLSNPHLLWRDARRRRVRSPSPTFGRRERLFGGHSFHLDEALLEVLPIEPFVEPFEPGRSDRKKEKKRPRATNIRQAPTSSRVSMVSTYRQRLTGL